MRFGESQSSPPVLFYQEDRDLRLVSRYRDRLRQAFRFVVPNPELVENLADKERFQPLAERLDLPVPATRRLRPADEAAPTGNVLCFPVVIKPVCRLNMERWEPIAGLAKARRVDTPAELRALWPLLRETGMDVLAQELVPGPETRVESYHVYADEHGKIVGEFTGRKIRTYPAEFGQSTALLVTETPDVAELGRDFVRRLNLHGVAKFDFKRGPDRKLYLLEVNARFTLWHHPAAIAGVNIPAMVFGDLTGHPDREARRVRHGVRWCRMWQDRLAATGEGMSLLRWLVWWLGCEAKSGVAWDDPMPIMSSALRRVSRRQRLRKQAVSATTAARVVDGELTGP